MRTWWIQWDCNGIEWKHHVTHFVACWPWFQGFVLPKSVYEQKRANFCVSLRSMSAVNIDCLPSLSPPVQEAGPAAAATGTSCPFNRRIIKWNQHRCDALQVSNNSWETISVIHKWKVYLKDFVQITINSNVCLRLFLKTSFIPEIVDGHYFGSKIRSRCSGRFLCLVFRLFVNL